MEEVTPNDDLFQNWVKCAKALNLACDPLAKFVEPANRRLHQNMLQSVQSVTYSTSCSFRNAEKCPSKVCNKLKFEIINTHRFHKPTFKNTELNSCWTEHWEMAKCYMSPGYKDIHTASETDFSGFINLVINHLHFQQEVKVDLNDPKNIFIQAREVRNTIMHNSKLEVTSFNLFVYLDVITQLLKDIIEGLKMQSSDRHARDWQIHNVNYAMSQIRSISSSGVSQEETHHVLLQANHAMRKMRREISQTIEATGEECRDSLKEAAKIGKLDIEMTTSVCRKIIEMMGKELVYKIVKHTEEGCGVIDRKITQALGEIDSRATKRISLVVNENENVAKDSQVHEMVESQIDYTDTVIVNETQNDNADKEIINELVETLSEKTDRGITIEMVEMPSDAGYKVKGNNTVETRINNSDKVITQEMVETQSSNTDIVMANEIVENQTMSTNTQIYNELSETKIDNTDTVIANEVVETRIDNIYNEKANEITEAPSDKVIPDKMAESQTDSTDILIVNQMVATPSDKTDIVIVNTADRNKSISSESIREILLKYNIHRPIGPSVLYELKDIENVEDMDKQTKSQSGAMNTGKESTELIKQIHEQLADLIVEIKPFDGEAFNAEVANEVELVCSKTKQIQQRSSKRPESQTDI